MRTGVRTGGRDLYTVWTLLVTLSCRASSLALLYYWPLIVTLLYRAKMRYFPPTWGLYWRSQIDLSLSAIFFPSLYLVFPLLRFGSYLIFVRSFASHVRIG